MIRGSRGPNGRGWWPARRSARGTAELSVVVVTTSLIAGVLFGNGATRTAVDIADGLTWFTDDPTGQVIEVNPATGRPEARIPVGEDGDELDIAQYDGRLIVTNRTTGELTSFDLTSILASGQQRVSPGGATDVLQHDGTVFLLDRDRGTIADIDPVTTDAIGEMWSSPSGIADAAIDGAGRVLSIDPAGQLTELRWSASSRAFVVEGTRWSTSFSLVDKRGRISWA
jgi:DNA-binding beta-propeller fold protein YncE